MISVNENFLYIGTVRGEVIKISKRGMEVASRRFIHKKNVYSAEVLNGFLHGIILNGGKLLGSDRRGIYSLRLKFRERNKWE